MKKSSFITLIFSVTSLVIFSLGMCMALLSEWNAFWEGVIFSSVGIVLGLITFIIWWKKENKKLPKVNKKLLFWVIYIVFATLVLGLGMCLCIVWEKFVPGTLIGLVGIILLIASVPLIKGLK